ncbi:hypothetical protein Tco_0531462 [Tanacetum coccineum]
MELRARNYMYMISASVAFVIPLGKSWGISKQEIQSWQIRMNRDYTHGGPHLEAALQAPPSPDYVPGPEEPEHALPSPDYVPGAEHADDEIIAEDQPYAKDADRAGFTP